MRTVYSAFCGSGKSYLCKTYPHKFKELECWEYQDKDFPDNYISSILKELDNVDYLFISTNPIVLKSLYDLGINIQLIYPSNELKSEYFDRYVERDSHPDFLKMLDENWDNWINELKTLNYCNHTVLKDGQYLYDII